MSTPLVEQKPFNGHPKLPLMENGGWLYFRDPVDGDPVPVAPTLHFSKKHSPRANGGPFFQSGWTYPTKEQAEAAYAFIVHACNTYYQREAELQALRDRVKEADAPIRGALKIAIADMQASGLTRTWCVEALKHLDALSNKP